MSEGVRDEEHEHEGSFAEGQEEREHHPEVEPKRDFAEGQEDDETEGVGNQAPDSSRSGGSEEQA